MIFALGACAKTDKVIQIMISIRTTARGPHINFVRCQLRSRCESGDLGDES